MADPSFKGKIVMQNPALLSIVGSSLTYLEPVYGNATWVQYMQGIAANNPVYTADSGVAVTDVATGEFAISFSEYHDALGAFAHGYPVVFNWLTPSPSAMSSDAITTLAPAPNMAQLFILWAASPQGQRAVFLYHAAVPGTLAYSSYYAKIPANVTILTVPPPNLYSNPDYWKTLYTNIFHPTG